MNLKKTIKRVVRIIPASSILMIHHVGVPTEKMISSCGITLENFEILMNRIKKRAGSINRAVNENGVVAVTFDDGYKETITLCYPILKQLSIPFTVFIVEDFIGKPGYLTLSDIRILAQDDLVTIGSHGKSHQILSSLSSDEINDEIIGSKERISKIIGKDVDFFAYSHGQKNALCDKPVKVYKYAFSANTMDVNFFTRKNKYYIPRLNITDKTLPDINKCFSI